MTLSEKFEKETGLASAMYVNLNLPPVPTPEYVEWLEAKVQETPPSESLKEAAVKWMDANLIPIGRRVRAEGAFIAGAEWAMKQNAQKQGFSDEDLDDARNCGYDEGWKDGANHMASIL